MLEIIWPAAAGVLSGIIIGMLPGIGTGIFMTMILPVLFAMDIDTLFIYYFSVMASTQYYGSVVATVFGIPGEISSIPATRYGHPLFLTSAKHTIVTDTATASLFGAGLSIILLWVLQYFFIEFLLYLLSGSVIVILLTLTMAIMIMTARQKMLALMLTLIGLLIGKIGLSTVFDANIMTMSWNQLESGIPLFPLLCGLIVIPILLKFNQDLSTLPIQQTTSLGIMDRLFLASKFSYWWASLRGSVVGFVVGLIPGASYTISSAVADTVENRFDTQDSQSNQRRLMAAESANNAAAISALIPLIVLGLPIMFSEAIVLNVAQSKGFYYTNSIEFFQNHITALILGLTLVSIVNWFLAGVFYNLLLSVYQRTYPYIYQLIMLVCILGMIFSAYQTGIVSLTVVIFIVFLTIGMIIHDIQSKFCLVVAYFLSPVYTDEIYRILLIQGIIQ